MKRYTEAFKENIVGAENGDRKCIKFIRSVLEDSVRDCPVDDLITLAWCMYAIALELDKKQLQDYVVGT